MISNDLLKQKILDDAIHGRLVENDLSLPPIEVEEIAEDIPFEIPSNWKWAKFKTIFNIVNGFTPLRTNKDFWNKQEVSWFTVEDIKKQGHIINETKQYISQKALKSSNRVLPANTVILCCTSATIGNYALTKIPLTTNQQWNGLVVKDIGIDSILPKYIFYFVQTLKKKMLIDGNSTTFPFISVQRIENYLISLPPIEEQKKIVSKIEELFALIDKKEKNDQEKENFKLLLKDKILDDAIHGRLVENDLSLPPIEVEEITEDIPFEIPSNWKWTLFENIAFIVRGGSPRPIKEYLTESKDGINWIKIGDANPNTFYIDNVKEKIIPEGIKKSRYVEKGSLLLTNSMSFGRPYILNVDGCIHDGWLNIKNKINYFNNMYIVYLLSSSYFYNVMSEKSSGSVVSNLNIDKVKTMLIPLPPIEEQKKIVSKIEELFALIDKL